MANWFLGSAQWTAVTAWAASTAYIVGDLRRQLATPTVGNERVWRCTTAGTSGGAEPAWNLTKGSTTNDNTAVWTEVTGNNTYSWSAAHARMSTAASWMASGGGDICFVSDNHAETQSTGLTVAVQGTLSVPNNFVCVDRTVTNPGASDVRTTATVSSSLSGSSGQCITINGNFGVFSGVSFQGANGGGYGVMAVQANISAFVNSGLYLQGTSGNNILRLGTNGGGGSLSRTILKNTPISLGSTNGAGIQVNGLVEWSDTPSAIQGPVPSTIFSGIQGYTAKVFARNVDFSAVGSGKTLFGITNATNKQSSSASMQNCRLASSVVLGNTVAGSTSLDLDVVECDVDGGAAVRNERWRHTGQLFTETTLIRTGGASDSVLGYSWRIVCSSAVVWIIPFDAIPIYTWNDVVGSSVTVTMEGIWSSTVVPTNEEVWMDTIFEGTSNSVSTTSSSGTKANILATGTSLTASTQAWDSLVAARVNSAAYVVGSLIKVASNSGRVFICTAITTGLASGSEPGGYASAVDGGSVTDGGCTFRAMVRFSMSASVTPQMAGWMESHIKAAKQSTTFYIDPFPVLS